MRPPRLGEQLALSAQRVLEQSRALREVVGVVTVGIFGAFIGCLLIVLPILLDLAANDKGRKTEIRN